VPVLAARAAVPGLCARGGPEPDGLWRSACGRGVLFGSAVASQDLADPSYLQLIARECALLTPTWEMKWASIQPEPGRFDFAATDRIAAFARDRGMMLRGHTLVWYRNLPGWLDSRLNEGNWEELLSRHIQAVVGRYDDAVLSWDVVNEAVEPTDGRDDGLRQSPWLRAAGPAYIAAAFKLAARFAPKARLVYNDYGCEHQADWTIRRRAAILKLLEAAKAAGAPVHGLGLQSHLRVGDPFDPRALRAFLGEVRQLEIVPMITEFDVRADRVNAPAEKDRQVADLARAYLETVMAENCDTVVCWGLSDDKNWRAADEPSDRPLPFDRDLAPKPFYNVLRSTLRAA
jgi:endo-1,4-beta-xylanase